MAASVPERVNYFLRTSRNGREFLHLSRVYVIVGDLLREQSQSGSLRPDLVRAIERNALLHKEDLAPILRHAVHVLSKEGKRRLLIDGVPRAMDQIEAVECALGHPDVVLFFDCPEDLAKQRFLDRQTPGRFDTEEVFDSRYDHYVGHNRQIVEYYEQKGVLVTVDTSGDIDSSYAKLLAALRSMG